jgi:type I restriction enzyme, S subunit
MSLRMRLRKIWRRLDMKSKLSDICFYCKEKIAIAELSRENYISTENMLPNKNGVTIAASLPTTIQTQKYEKGDVLVSNIRPYFKKIWLANKKGGCSNDVLVFRAKNDIEPRYLYYVLANNSFFEYSMATAKGTKMPRGDKKALMEYGIPDFDLKEQHKIASILSTIDDKIQLNNKINKNLAA